MKQYYQAQKYLVKILEQKYGIKNKDALFAAKTAKKEYEYFPDLSIQPSEDLNDWADKIYNKFIKDTYPELESIQIELLNILCTKYGLTRERAEVALEEYSLRETYKAFPLPIILTRPEELARIICLVTGIIDVYREP